jgi:hypothetical protein
VTHEAPSCRGLGPGFLADMGWGNARWVCRKFQRLEDLPDGLAAGEGGDDPPCLPLTPGAARHSQRRQRTIANTKTRVSSHAQLQRSDPVSVTSSFTPVGGAWG